MKYLDEFRDPGRIQAAAEALHRETRRPWTIMEICGGQTHSIAQHGIEDLLPEGMRLVHGPGCPVCVTPLEVLESARRLALRPDVVLCTFGDMMRVPGVHGDLLTARAEGADVRIVLSPLDAVRLAERTPEREVVFFGVGFETTAPATAMAIDLARRSSRSNFSVLASHVRVPPAMDVILSAPDNAVQAFLAAGHVCTVTGTTEYGPIAARHRVPIVITGFEPVDILLGLRVAVGQLEQGEAGVKNAYDRVVRADGNPAARAKVTEIFEVSDRAWRGMGVIAEGGLRIREELERFDAVRKLGLQLPTIAESTRCRAADVLRGRLSPPQCPEFGRGCTPDRPLGAPMVSSEGACAAYHRYRHRMPSAPTPVRSEPS